MYVRPRTCLCWLVVPQVNKNVKWFYTVYPSFYALYPSFWVAKCFTEYYKYFIGPTSPCLQFCLTIWYPIDCRSFLDIYRRWHGFNNVCGVQTEIIILNSYLRFARQLSAIVSAHWLEKIHLFLHSYKYHIRTRQVLLQACRDCKENVCLDSSFSKKGGRSYKNNT